MCIPPVVTVDMDGTEAAIGLPGSDVLSQLVFATEVSKVLTLLIFKLLRDASRSIWSSSAMVPGNPFLGFGK